MEWFWKFPLCHLDSVLPQGIKSMAYLRWQCTIYFVFNQKSPEVSITESNLQKQFRPSLAGYVLVHTDTHLHTHLQTTYYLSAWHYTQEKECWGEYLCASLFFLMMMQISQWKCLGGKRVEKRRWFSPHLYFKVNPQAKWISSSKMFSVKDNYEIPWQVSLYDPKLIN